MKTIIPPTVIPLIAEALTRSHSPILHGLQEAITYNLQRLRLATSQVEALLVEIAYLQKRLEEERVRNRGLLRALRERHRVRKKDGKARPSYHRKKDGKPKRSTIGTRKKGR